jgi:hypothetical protein
MKPKNRLAVSCVTGFALLLLIGASSPEKSNQAWGCIGEHAVGFAPDTQGRGWHEARFETGKYVITQASGKDALGKVYWKVSNFGDPETSMLAYCRNDFDAKLGDTKCDLFNGDFLFNRITLRFTRITATAGYINYDAPGVGGALPPTLEIGTCSTVTK